MDVVGKMVTGMADMMNFPKRWEDFLHDYEFEDARRIYTNGSRLIPSFRVKQMMEHYAPVRHGRWELTVHSFYRDTFDESCELCVYIVANCSECSGKHPNSYQVFSKTIYDPEDAGDDFRFDQKEEENKALQEFQRSNYKFAYYCPNCGAKMDGGAD